MEAQQTTFTIPLTWTQWKELGRPDTFDEFKTYVTAVIGDQRTLLSLLAVEEGPMTEINIGFKELTAQIEQSGGAALKPPAEGLVTTAATLYNLTTGAVTECLEMSVLQNEGTYYEAQQSKDSWLHGDVKIHPVDSDLILASTNGVVGWNPKWASGPIEVDINHPKVIEEIRVLCAFILCTDTVVGMVTRDDAKDKKASYGGPAFASSLVDDDRKSLDRSVTCQNFGTMRSWHMDEKGYLTKLTSVKMPGPRRTAYEKRNSEEFAQGRGIDDKMTKGSSKMTPKGYTEFNASYGTNGRIIFDYRAGAFYLSGHYQEYEAPKNVLKANEIPKAKSLQCYPYFKLTDPHRIRLSIRGIFELGRLRFWENQRRAGFSDTLGK